MTKPENFQKLWKDFEELAQSKKIPIETLKDLLAEAIKTIIDKIDPDAEVESVWVKRENALNNEEELKLYTQKEVYSDLAKIFFADTNNLSQDDLDFERVAYLNLEEALKIDPNAQVGDFLKATIPYNNFSQNRVKRIGQIFRQNLATAAKKELYETYKDRIGEPIKVKIETIDPDSRTVVSFLEDPNTRSSISTYELLKTHPDVKMGHKLTLFVKEVVAEPLKYQDSVILTTTSILELIHLLKSTYEEINNGQIIIKKVARRIGQKSKVAVAKSLIAPEELNIMEILIGFDGQKMNALKDELGEGVEFVLYDEDATNFIQNALLPAKAISVTLVRQYKSSMRPSYNIIVPDSMVSLAIGKRGLNVALISDLVHARINVTSYSEASEEAKANHKELLWNGNIASPEELEELETIYQQNKRVPQTRRKSNRYTYGNKSNFDMSSLSQEIDMFQQYFEESDRNDNMVIKESAQNEPLIAQVKAAKKAHSTYREETKTQEDNLDSYLDNLSDTDFNMINDDIVSSQGDNLEFTKKEVEDNLRSARSKNKQTNNNALSDYEIPDADFRDFALEDIDLDDFDDENWK